MATTIRSFRDMRVWQSAQVLCVNIYKVTNSFPKQEMFGLASQMQRAAVSVPSNIAEGFGRRGAKEKEQFYHHALGSLFELDTQTEIALRLRYAGKEQYQIVRKQIDQTQAMLIKLLKVNNDKTINR